MATTEILPFALDPSANVQTQADYAAVSSRTLGFSDGIAPTQEVNKIWRQAAFMAAGLANWMVLHGISVPDDGNLSALVTEIEQAMAAFLPRATQAQQEAATSADVLVTPSQQQAHPSAAKAWCYFDGTGSVTIHASYNVASITKNATGDWTINWATPFSSANYVVICTSNPVDTGSTVGMAQLKPYNSGTSNLTTGSARIQVGGTGGNNILADAAFIMVVAYGDQ